MIMLDDHTEDIKFDDDDLDSDSMPLPVTGLILCGGKSKRMGRPKAFLPYEGTTIINHLVRSLRGVFRQILLVSNEPEDFEDLGIDVVKDILPHRGPMGGILSGLLVAHYDHSFVIACDMPLVDKNLILSLAKRRRENDVVIVSHDRGVEPLLGVYSKACVKPLEESLFSGTLSVKDLLGDLSCSMVKVRSSDNGDLPVYFNVNTPKDYSRLITKSSVETLSTKDSI